MLERILTSRQELLLADERAALRQLEDALVRHEAKREDRDTLARSIRQLDELFLLVVVGEFNAGKSTFINALLANRLLDEGVTPTTTRIHRLRHGDVLERTPVEDGMEDIRAPVEFLRQVEIVDTPGTNALERRHEAITEEFVPRSDLVLFVTSADRPFTESERAFIERVREWGKKLVIVVNKIDILRQEGERGEVEAFVRDNARRLLGIEPEVFLVSARRALDAKLDGGGSEAMAESRFEALERYLVETLDDTERVRLKLLNPLGVGLRLAGSYLRAVESRDELLKDDFKTLGDIELQLGLYREDLGVQFRFRLSDVDNELLAFEKRGQEFFDETLRLARAFDLLNKERLRADYERKVVADAPQRIEKKVEEIIDWMVEAELEQWRAASEHLEKRRGAHPGRLVGEIGRFDYNRRQLLETVGRAAQRTVASFDQRSEARRMAESVQTAVAGTALVEVGAIGLGAVFTLIATTQLADFTGILAAGTLAVLGLFILPARRRKAKAELAAKIAALRERLMAALTEQFDRELDRSVQRVQEAIAPYTRFVRAERQRLTEMREAFDGARAGLERLKAAIGEL